MIFIIHFRATLLAAFLVRGLNQEAGISKGIVRKDGVFSFVRHYFSFLEGARGPITLQLFTDSSRENFLAIEINPRFGGGYPMSHAAGVDYPGILIRELLFGENPGFIQSYKSDILMLRYDAMISLDKASATLSL